MDVATVAAAGPQQLCTFSVGDLLLGIDVMFVQEVLHEQPMTRVPLADPVVRGLINLRGQIVTALDVRRRLGLSDRSGEARFNVVVQGEREAVSLLVDDVRDILDVDPDGLEAPPETMEDRARSFVDAVWKLSDGLLLVLDVGAVTALSVGSGTRGGAR